MANSPQRGGVPYSPAPLAGCPLLPSLEPGLFTATRNTIPSGCVDLLLAGVQLPGTFLALAAGALALPASDRPPAADGAAQVAGRYSDDNVLDVAETSKGTQSEIARAHELGKPVFFSVDGLVEWRNYHGGAGAVR